MDKKKLDDFVKKVEDNTNDALEDTLLDKEAKLEDTRGFTYDDIVKISTKDKISKLPWLISIFLILTISLAFGYMFFKGNPQTIFINTVDKFFTFLSDNIGDETYDITKGNLSLDLNVSGNNFDFGSIKMDANYVLDKANGLSRFKISSSDNLDIDIYSDNKNLYVYPKGIYDGYIKYSFEENVSMVKPNDIKALLSGVNQAFDKVAAEEKISGNKVNYDLGNKTIKVYQSSLIVDSKNSERVIETFTNSLKSNEEFVSSMGVILNVSSDVVKSKLDNLLIKGKNYLNDDEKIEIKLYTDRKTNDFFKGEMIFKDGSFEFTKIDEDSFSIGVSSEALNGNVSIDIDKKKYTIKFDLDGFTSIKGDVILSNKKASSFGKVKMDKVVDEKDLTDLEKSEIYGKLFGSSFTGKMSTNLG